jgi:hypothetical protein
MVTKLFVQKFEFFAPDQKYLNPEMAGFISNYEQSTDTSLTNLYSILFNPVHMAYITRHKFVESTKL